MAEPDGASGTITMPNVTIDPLWDDDTYFLYRPSDRYHSIADLWRDGETWIVSDRFGRRAYGPSSFAECCHWANEHINVLDGSLEEAPL